VHRGPRCSDRLEEWKGKRSSARSCRFQSSGRGWLKSDVASASSRHSFQFRSQKDRGRDQRGRRCGAWISREPVSTNRIPRHQRANAPARDFSKRQVQGLMVVCQGSPFPGSPFHPPATLRVHVFTRHLGRLRARAAM
jgi:hypothetical protein